MESDYKEYERLRNAYTQEAIDSESSRKLIMAGPGTGKSFLFQEIARKLRNQGKENIIVLTFINELVKDLAVDMYGLARVSTLHSFAAKELRSQQNIYLDLLKVITTDFEAETDRNIDYSSILNNLDTKEYEDELNYLSRRRQYYKSYDAASIVYDLINLYIADETKIPEYDMVMIDEYQDFNELEVKLIELLATKNPVLIVGDDDQSLYSFKDAKPEKIRELFASYNYDNFELPYCMRSTKAVIYAFQDFLREAQNNGYLGNRVDKQYWYFPDPEKDKYSEDHPAIDVHTNVYHTKNAYMLDQEISKLFQYEQEFDVLVICPLAKQVAEITVPLRKKGYTNVSGDEQTNKTKKILAEGLNILSYDKESNLGWRLCAKSLTEPQVLTEAIRQSADFQTQFKQCLPQELASHIKKLRAITKKLQYNNEISEDDQRLIFEELDVKPYKLAKDLTRDLIFGSSFSSKDLHNSINIKVTTILGSKGLSYDYVFMVNFEDRYLIPRGGRMIDDESINKFLVALTRSRKKTFVFTSKNMEPTFTNWIDNERKNIL